MAWAMNNSDSKILDTKPLDANKLEDAILDVLARSGTKTLSAPEIAHAIADDNWHPLLTPIRSSAIELARAGRLVIYRKGKPVDPNDFRGVYRVGLPRHD